MRRQWPQFAACSGVSGETALDPSEIANESSLESVLEPTIFSPFADKDFTTERSFAAFAARTRPGVEGQEPLWND
jgi:hypothetical protein